MPCHRMDTVTYPHLDVKSELDENWLQAALDVTVERDVTSMFRIAAIPTAVAVAGDGTVIGSILGFVDPAPFAQRLQGLR